jgi:hypothetical protein
MEQLVIGSPIPLTSSNGDNMGDNSVVTLPSKVEESVLSSKRIALQNLLRVNQKNYAPNAEEELPIFGDLASSVIQSIQLALRCRYVSLAP